MTTKTDRALPCGLNIVRTDSEAHKGLYIYLQEQFVCSVRLRKQRGVGRSSTITVGHHTVSLSKAMLWGFGSIALAVGFGFFL